MLSLCYIISCLRVLFVPDPPHAGVALGARLDGRHEELHDEDRPDVQDAHDHDEAPFIIVLL